MLRLAMLLTALLTSTSVTLAHPGHGTTDPAGVVHHVAEPVHVLPVVTALIVLTVIAWSLSRVARKR